MPCGPEGVAPCLVDQRVLHCGLQGTWRPKARPGAVGNERFVESSGCGSGFLDLGLKAGAEAKQPLSLSWCADGACVAAVEGTCLKHCSSHIR